VFSHYGELIGDPFDSKSQAGKVVTQIRKRKGLKEELPIVSDYIDKLWNGHWWILEFY